MDLPAGLLLLVEMTLPTHQGPPHSAPPLSSHIHTRSHTDTLTRMLTKRSHTHSQTLTFTHRCAYTPTHPHIFAHMCSHELTDTHVLSTRSHMCSYTRTLAHTHIHTPTHTFTLIHVFSHTRSHTHPFPQTQRVGLAQPRPRRAGVRCPAQHGLGPATGIWPWLDW